MNDAHDTPSAMDGLVLENPSVNPNIVARARDAVARLKKLGLFSTDLAEAIRPFKGKPPQSQPAVSRNPWTKRAGIVFRKSQ